MTSLFLWLSIIVLFQRGWTNYSEIPPTVIMEKSKHLEVIHYSVLHSCAVSVSLVKDFHRGWGRYYEIFAVKQLKHYQYKEDHQIGN